MKLRYYAWIRDCMGCDSEDIVLPNEIKNVGMLLDWLSIKGEQFNMASEYIDVVMVSVNLHYADRDHPVCDEDEVCLVPPIGGG